MRRARVDPVGVVPRGGSIGLRRGREAGLDFRGGSRIVVAASKVAMFFPFFLGELGKAFVDDRGRARVAVSVPTVAIVVAASALADFLIRGTFGKMGVDAAYV